MIGGMLMGMPISSYLLLKTIADGNDNNLLKYSEAIRAIKDFNLYVFILHDPEEHKEFHRALIQKFDRMDYITGSRLLFFALVDPPKEWLEHGRNRPYYRHINNFETQELLSPYNQVFSKDPSVTTLSIANMLKIPYESLPCIVIFPNFKVKEFIWYKTCPEHLEEQLKELGYIAERSTRNNYIYENDYSKKGRDYYHQGYMDVVDKIRQSNLNLCGDKGNQILEDRLAKILSDCLSAVVANTSTDTNTRRLAKENRNDFLANLSGEILRFKKSNKDGMEEEDIKLLEDLCIKFITSIFNDVSYEINDDDLVINKRYLERDSYIMLKTAHTVFNDLKREYLNRKSEYDFTASAICFSKVYEKEINLSQVHWIRKHLGIDLPRYYNSYQPQKEAKFRTSMWNRKEINFNRHYERNRWKPPGIGESRICWQDLIRINVPNGWDEKELVDLNERWEKIVDIRNMSAHSEVVDLKLVEELINHLKYIEERQYFRLLSEMKQSFSNV